MVLLGESLKVGLARSKKVVPDSGLRMGNLRYKGSIGRPPVSSVSLVWKERFDCCFGGQGRSGWKENTSVFWDRLCLDENVYGVSLVMGKTR